MELDDALATQVLHQLRRPDAAERMLGAVDGAAKQLPVVPRRVGAKVREPGHDLLLEFIQLVLREGRATQDLLGNRQRLAEILGEPVQRIEQILCASALIQPCAYMGNSRLFDRIALDRIRDEIIAIEIQRNSKRGQWR